MQSPVIVEKMEENKHSEEYDEFQHVPSPSDEVQGYDDVDQIEDIVHVVGSDVPHLEVFGDGEEPVAVNNNGVDHERSDEEFARALAMQMAAEEDARKRKAKQDRAVKNAVKREIAAAGPLNAHDPLWREKRAQAMAAADNDQEAANLYVKLAPQQPQQQRPQQRRYPKVVPANAHPGDDGVFFRDAPQLPELWGPGMEHHDDAPNHGQPQPVHIAPHLQGHDGAWKQDRAVAMANARDDEEAAQTYLSMGALAAGRKKDVLKEQEQIEASLRHKADDKPAPVAPNAPAPVPAVDQDDSKLEQQRALAMANADNDEQAARIYIGMKDLAIGKKRDPVVQQRLVQKQLELKKIWVCRTCTFYNSITQRKCQTCKTIRSVEKAQFRSWKCSQCTLDNDASNFSCSACGKGKNA